MKRIILIVLPILFLSGCTINYNLEFKNNKFIEIIDGAVSNDELSLEEGEKTDVNINYYNLYIEENPLIDNNEEVYDKQITDVANGKKFVFNYEYDDNYNKSKAINYCFEDKIFEEDEDFYYIKLGGKFGCLYSDEININLKSDKAILDANADSIKNNTYTWIINQENKDNVDITLSISKNVYVNKENNKFEVSTFQIIAFVILIVLSLITYLLYKKKNSSTI